MLEFGKWLKIFDYQNVVSFFESERDKGTLAGALFRVFVAQLIISIPSALIYLLYVVLISGSLALAGRDGLPLAAMVGGFGFIGVILLFIFGLIMGLIMFLVNNGIIHLFAGLLGGKGTYTSLNHFYSFISAGLSLVSLVLWLIAIPLAFIPCGSCLIWLIAIIFLVYLLYLLVMAIRVNYGLSTGRAVATLVLFIVLWVAIYIVIILILLLLGLLALASLGAISSGSGYY